jgi:hypothetical protein
MLDDARDRQIRRWQQAGRGRLPLDVDERGRGNRSVLIEALHERFVLVAGLEIRMRQIMARHQLIVAGCRAPPTGSRRTCPDLRVSGVVAEGRRLHGCPPAEALEEANPNGSGLSLIERRNPASSSRGHLLRRDGARRIGGL